MCIAIPMQVQSVNEFTATCTWQGTSRVVDIFLLGDDVAPGDWLLVFHESAREKITAERAQQVSMALEALDIAMTGTLPPEEMETRIAALFPDLPHRHSPGSDVQ